jgi:hypothetical protein
MSLLLFLPIRCYRVLSQGTISTGGYSLVAELGKKIAEIHAKVEPFREDRGTGN